MPKCPYISQVVQRDCGVAALAMILKNYGSSYSLGKQLGFETQAIRADLDLFK